MLRRGLPGRERRVWQLGMVALLGRAWSFIFLFASTPLTHATRFPDMRATNCGALSFRRSCWDALQPLRHLKSPRPVNRPVNDKRNCERGRSEATLAFKRELDSGNAYVLCFTSCICYPCCPAGKIWPRYTRVYLIAVVGSVVLLSCRLAMHMQ